MHQYLIAKLGFGQKKKLPRFEIAKGRMGLRFRNLRLVEIPGKPTKLLSLRGLRPIKIAFTKRKFETL